MKTVLVDEKCKEIKAKAPKGPWTHEPDLVFWVDEATGLPCIMRRHTYYLTWCGYVGCPKDTPLPDDEAFIDDDTPPQMNIRVHGGLTGGLLGDGELPEDPKWAEFLPAVQWDNMTWPGFDCGHSGIGDLSPVDAEFESEEAQYRDQAFVENECTKLAAQLFSMTAAQ